MTQKNSWHKANVSYNYTLKKLKEIVIFNVTDKRLNVYTIQRLQN